MKRYNIYKTTNLANGKFYWGVHDSIDENDGYLGGGIVLWKAIKKYGKDSFRRKTMVIYETAADAFFDEGLLVTQKYLDENPMCYNVAPGGCGGNLWGEKEKHPMFGRHHSDESRKKMRMSHAGKMPWNTGKYLSEEHKQKISLRTAGKNNPMYGRHLVHSEETKEKMSKSKMGNINGFKKGGRSLNYGKTGENSPNYGSHRSEEQKQNMRNAWIKRKIKGEIR